jgi:hypothetical protein
MISAHDPGKHTFTIPSVSPVASISPSLENVNDNTAASCIISSSRAWYGNSFLSRHVSGSQTSTKPSSEPVTRCWPSGEKRAHSGCVFEPNLIWPTCVLAQCACV